MPILPGARSNDIGKLLLRLALGAVMLFHGAYKIMHGVDWMKPILAQVGLPRALAYGTYVAEVIAPVLLILGVQVRFAAFIVAFDMFMAIGLVLRHQIFSVQAQGGGWAIELQAILLLVALSLAVLGGRRYGIAIR
jgi:putative oxidoreductase